jgi:two-component system sensor histidine kinase/response regulator
MNTPDSRRPRALVVDDNEVNQITAVRMLGKLQVDADVAVDGHQAIAACRQRTYDFVLMDCEMPGMDGFTATAEWRRSETAPARLPIVAVTANALPGVRERCLAAGMDDCMSKPLRLADLRDMVARWTNTARAGDAGAIDFGVIDELRDVDAAFTKELIGKFSSEVEDRMAALRQACADHDAAALAQLGHRLKGSCLTLGAIGMANMCAALEQSAKAADFDRGSRLGHELEQEFGRVRLALQQRAG